MAIVRLPAAHRTWEDWVGIGFGSLIVLSPLFVGQTIDETVVLNTGLIGTVVLALAALQLGDLHRWEQLVELASGFWLIASPFIFGYDGSGDLRYWHFALGALVAFLAVFELWQDRNLSAEELAHHGY